MDSSSLSLILDQSEQLNEETQEFAVGLLKLARHWRGDDGVEFIRHRIKEATSKGLPMQEAMIESYQYLRPKIF